MNIHAMTTEQLQAASRDLGALVDDIMAEYPEAARVVVDAMGMVAEELCARAFGGGPEAREYAAKLRRRRSGH